MLVIYQKNKQFVTFVFTLKLKDYQNIFKRIKI